MGFSLASCFDKMASDDSDFRYMGLSDLLQELSKESFKIDGSSEGKLCTWILKLLGDITGDVQGLAVKCLPPMATRLSCAQLEDLAEKLCSNVLTGKEEMRDISGIALKSVIGDMPPGFAPMVCRRILPRMVTALTLPETNAEAKIECVEILGEMLKRFGAQLASDHHSLQGAILAQLSSPKSSLRKRATAALAHLSAWSNDSLFQELAQSLTELLTSATKPDLQQSYVHCIASVSRSGLRVAPFLPAWHAALVKIVDTDDEVVDELREQVFKAFETFIFRCSKDVAPFVPQVLDLVHKFLKYDPNYADMDDDDADADAMDTSMEEEDDDDEDAYSDDADYSDDDDMSWKVRRACAKVIVAVVTTRADLLADHYAPLSKLLSSRFREREETVKLEVFAAYSALVRQSHAYCATLSGPLQDALRATMAADVEKVMHATAAQFKDKSVKVKVGIVGVAKVLVVGLGQALAPHVAALLGGIKTCFVDKNATPTLKIDALVVVRSLAATVDPAVVQPHLSIVCDQVAKAVCDSYYKITAEGLRTVAELVRVLRPSPPESAFDVGPFAKPLYDAMFTKLQAQDIDQEVKECAINAAAMFVSRLGDHLAADTPGCLSVLLDRLRNEITRLVAVRAFCAIAQSPLKIDLSATLPTAVPEMCTFLRKSNRSLKLNTLQTLRALSYEYRAALTADLVGAILVELPASINETDFQLTAHALQLATACIETQPTTSVPIVIDKVLASVHVLVRSPLLQGASLQAMMEFFAALAALNHKQLSSKAIIDSLLKHADTSLSKQATSSVAKCIAAVSRAVPAADSKSTITNFVTAVSKGSKADDKALLLPLYCLGEIGQLQDLSSFAGLYDQVMSALDSKSDEVKSAASYCLGRICSGNLELYLPSLVDNISKNPDKEYLLLHALLELLSRMAETADGISKTEGSVQALLDVLFSRCDNDEESIRNAAAECLGKLALIGPATVAPELDSRLSSDNANVRASVVSALRYAIADPSSAADDVLAPRMAKFKDLLCDSDMSVKKSAMLAMNAVVHHKPALMHALLADLLPVLFAETAINQDLIRVVDLGPFKHTVDDGLELRKAAFSVMSTLLDNSLALLDVSEFLVHLAKGLKDVYDIRQVCHMMLARLAGPDNAPQQVAAALDILVDPLRATVTTKLKDTAVKQEIERNEDLVRSALRAISAINNVPEAATSVKFVEFMKTTIRVSPLVEKFEAISGDSAGDADGDAVMTDA